MALDDKVQSISIRLSRDNYSYWASVMKNFLIGRGRWGYVTGITVKPSDSKVADFEKSIATWEMENAQVLTWFHNSVESSIGQNFSKFETAKRVWEYLQLLYQESNFAKHYQLEMEIRGAQQGDKTIQDFYNQMTCFWDQLALMEPADLLAFDSYINYRERQRLVQFLMALKEQFEPLRGAMLHRVPLPTVDGAVKELLAEETRFKVAQNVSPSPSVFATSILQPPLLQTPPRSLIQITGKPKQRVSNDECSFCHQKGHWKVSCPKLQKGRPLHNQRPPHHNSQRFPAALAVQAPSAESLLEQFQSILANATMESHASTSTPSTFHSGLATSSNTGLHVQETDWDWA